MKALITGASGFIGSHLAVDLAQRGFEVIALRNSTPLKDCMPASVLEEICDIRQRSSVHRMLKKYNPDLLIHAAALSKTFKCEDSPELCSQTNVEGTANIADFYKNCADKPILIYLSSDLVFEGKDAPQGGFPEESEPLPLSIYAKSKFLGEKIWEEISPGAFIFRVCLCYGPNTYGGENALTWICESFENKKELNLFHDEWRTPVFVGDISRAAIAVFNKFQEQTSQRCQVFNLAGPQRFSRVEFAKEIARVLNYDERLIVEKSRLEFESKTPRARDVSLSCDKLQSELGILPTTIEKAFFSG